MVGELTYEENFVDEGILSQTIFLIMVIILTTLLNNLLIGLTTSNADPQIQPFTAAYIYVCLYLRTFVQSCNDVTVLFTLAFYCYK